MLFTLESFVDSQHKAYSNEIETERLCVVFNQGFSGDSWGLPHNIEHSLISL